MTAFRVLSALVVAAVLSACASQEPRALPRASAVPETVRVEMAYDARDNGLTWAQLDLIAAVASEYKARGHGPLVISYPQNSPGGGAAIAVIADARAQLFDHGLDWRAITGGAYDARGRSGAPIIFSFTRYQASVPVCDRSWPDLRNAPPGRAWPEFGCSTAANLAAQVSDPRDLVAARTMEASDAARREVVIERYRQGQPTSSQRSAEESGTVSTAVGN
ncbi:pilus assembly protein CpaD [Alkalicaulis satelles]|uniref:Pilus assembly protein CpaD n=1 Tax=Alkalicaulis satelles TaxID=2609175 RepID=A0A5M6ZE75_9PROT|nr:CpaD family pilus assembly protein [Alkalicaulis satelles]KAA5802194.1 pilus assembly protein CpaD [Alkalicaulis satelles]